MPAAIAATPTCTSSIPLSAGHSKLTSGHGITGSKNGLRVDGYYDPVWSPDGSQILFGRQFIDPDGGYHEGLAYIDPDGTDMAWADAGEDFGHQPDWGTAPLK
jgi:hypothetical protein